MLLGGQEAGFTVAVSWVSWGSVVWFCAWVVVWCEGMNLGGSWLSGMCVL